MSTLKLKGSSSGEAEVTVAAAAGTPTITLPTASIDLSTAGTDGQFLKTNGSGTLSFADAGGITDLTPYFMSEDDHSGAGEISITHATTTLIAPDEIYDSASDYNPSTGAWTPSTAGKYWVYQHVLFSTESNKTYCNLLLYKNGSNHDATRYGQIRSIVNGTSRFSVTNQYIVTANGSSDYWDTRVYIHDYTGGGNLEVRKVKFGAFKIDD